MTNPSTSLALQDASFTVGEACIFHEVWITVESEARISNILVSVCDQIVCKVYIIYITQTRVSSRNDDPLCNDPTYCTCAFRL